MNEKLKLLLTKYRDDEITYSSLLSQLGELLANNDIDKETYLILIGLL